MKWYWFRGTFDQVFFFVDEHFMENILSNWCLFKCTLLFVSILRFWRIQSRWICMDVSFFV